MTYPELQIQLDLNPDNRLDVLENADTCRWTVYGYLFVDQEDGQCYLFDKNGNLDDINNVKSFGNEAFIHCELLTRIKIPNSVETIGSWAFDNCTSLKSIEIPDSVKHIEYWTFLKCTSLTSIEIPSSVESIGDLAFGSCASLKEVVFKGKTIKQVKAMKYYPWGIKYKSIIKVES